MEGEEAGAIETAAAFCMRSLIAVYWNQISLEDWAMDQEEAVVHSEAGMFFAFHFYSPHIKTRTNKIEIVPR